MIVKDITIRDWYAGNALGNSSICNGSVSEDWLTEKFGKNVVSKAAIVTAQAYEYADAMISSLREGKL